MSISGVNNSADGALSLANQSHMQAGRAGPLPHYPTRSRGRNEIHGTLAGSKIPTLTLAEFTALDCFEAGAAMCSPTEAFSLRLSGQINPSGPVPTLHSYLTSPGFIGDEAHTTLRTRADNLPQPHSLITVFCIPTGSKGAPYGVILPGTYVAISKSLARLMAKLGPNVKAPMHSTSVYPDELIYQGDLHGFVYIPRSPLLGFERYQADLHRAQTEEKMRVQRVGYPSDTRAENW